MADPHAEIKDDRGAKTAAALAAVYAAARDDVLTRVNLTGDVVNVLRAIWPEAVRATTGKTAKGTAEAVAAAADPARMAAYLEKVSESFAETWAENVAAQLDEIAGQIDVTFDQTSTEAARVMGNVVDSADGDGRNITYLAANFAAIENARADGGATKTWHTVVDRDTRSSHAGLNGMTIPIDGRFPNGLPYPHAPGPPDETINCRCYLTFGG